MKIKVPISIESRRGGFAREISEARVGWIRTRNIGENTHNYNHPVKN